uniref:SpaH/EbpB family LPXTG-anchored major pilin n=1 Tax=Cellulomonas hominis TaxID=156981 RepID=UPI0018AC7968|nr:SpaH/EbpB family LPXTG-anchored major pilin [Cellulomonas hominis]
MSNPVTGGRLRAAAALLAGGALALTGMGVANAATTIDPTESASLTIHKYEQPTTATGLPNDGRELDPSVLAGLTALPGVEFTAKQVPGIDLTTNAGWEAAADMTSAEAAAAVASVTGVSGTTAADGTLTFSGLPLGLYYVAETYVPMGVTAAAPFLVTLPLTDPVDNASWMYDVHVYPKNSTTHTDKTIQDEDAVAVGDDVLWQITSTIPVGGTDGFKMVDLLDARLTYKSVAVRIGATTLTEGTHYTVTTPDVGGRTQVSVQLTAAGLAIANDNLGQAIVFDLTTTVVGTGEIANEADIYNNQTDIDNEDPSDTTGGCEPGDEDCEPTDPPVTKFGELTISKVDATNSATLLAGAVFQVYTSESDALSGTNPVTINGVSSWTSGADGKVSISGLRYSNWENGAELPAADWQHYWLVETTAPAGYELLAAPVQFDVTSNDATVIDLTVENVEADAGFTLPLTGGSGIALLMIGGTALIVGAIMIGARNRRAAVTA